MAAAMHHIDARSAGHDPVLMLNGDVELPPGLFADLAAAAAIAGLNTMRGCPKWDLDKRHPSDIGRTIDCRPQLIRLLLTAERAGSFVDVDRLAGRGLPFIVRLVREIAFLDGGGLPRYWGDIECMALAQNFGYRVASAADRFVSTSFAPSRGAAASGDLSLWFAAVWAGPTEHIRRRAR